MWFFFFFFFWCSAVFVLQPNEFHHGVKKKKKKKKKLHCIVVLLQLLPRRPPPHSPRTTTLLLLLFLSTHVRYGTAADMCKAIDKHSPSAVETCTNFLAHRPDSSPGYHSAGSPATHTTSICLSPASWEDGQRGMAIITVTKTSHFAELHACM